MFPPGGGGKGGGNGNAVARKVIHPERLLPAPAGPSEGRTSPRRAALGRAGVGEEETRGPDGRPSGGVALACTPPVPTGHLRQTSSQMHGPGRKEAAGAGASGQPPLPCPSLSPPAHTRGVCAHAGSFGAPPGRAVEHGVQLLSTCARAGGCEHGMSRAPGAARGQ